MALLRSRSFKSFCNFEDLIISTGINFAETKFKHFRYFSHTFMTYMVILIMQQFGHLRTGQSTDTTKIEEKSAVFLFLFRNC